MLVEENQRPLIWSNHLQHTYYTFAVVVDAKKDLKPKDLKNKITCLAKFIGVAVFIVVVFVNSVTRNLIALRFVILQVPIVPKVLPF